MQINRIFGLLLLLGLSFMVLVSIGLLIFEWFNSSNDVTNQPVLTPKPSSRIFYYQLPSDYSLIDVRNSNGY